MSIKRINVKFSLDVESLLLCEADMQSYKSFHGLVPLNPMAIKNEQHQPAATDRAMDHGRREPEKKVEMSWACPTSQQSCWPGAHEEKETGEGCEAPGIGF